MHVTRILALTMALLCAALLAVACGGDEEPAPAATPTPVPAATATPTPADAMEPKEPTEPAATPTPLPPGVTPPPATPTPTSPPPPTATPIPGFDPEDHFGGRRIAINVGYSPGGGYDTYARLMAKFLPKHIPGNPRFVVRNLVGGGGERIFKPTFVDSEPNGFAVAVVHPRFFKRELVGIDVPNFDPNTLKILGTASAVRTTSAQYAFRDFATTWEEAVAKGKDLVVGATEPGDGGGIATTFIELVGGPVKNVYGYPGSSDIAAAFDRRELDISNRGGPDIARSLFPEWVENQQIVPLFYWGADPSQDQEFYDYVTKDLGAEIPPHLFDIIDLTEEQKTLFSVTETINEGMSRLFIIHPDTPEHIYQLWVDAFRATAHDPEFIEAAKLLGREVGYYGPEDIARVIAEGTEALKDPVLREGFILLAGGVD
jgi:tripartite-type tricarboxylate transporter receptor subunit TctC